MQTSTIQWIPQGETRVPLAVYRDDHGERLQLKRRVVVCDSSRFDTLLAVPL